MTIKASQEELQAATNAAVRAHATSDEVTALVARLAPMLSHAVGLDSLRGRLSFTQH
jgi:hypothetical protein